MAKVEGNNFRTITGAATDVQDEKIAQNLSRHYLAVFNKGDADMNIHIGIINPATGVPDGEFSIEGGCAWMPNVPPTNGITLRADSGQSVDYLIHEG